MKYKYRCTLCKKRSTIEHPMNEDAKKKCPKCGQEGLVRIIQKSAIVGDDGFSKKLRL